MLFDLSQRAHLFASGKTTLANVLTGGIFVNKIEEEEMTVEVLGWGGRERPLSTISHFA